MNSSFLCACGLGLLAVTACGPTMPAAATRIVAADAAVLKQTPVCFAPPPLAPDLTLRAQQQRMLQICEAAARSEHVPVIPYGTGQCLVATMTWASRETGDRVGDCTGWYAYATCTDHAVRLKSMKLTLSPLLGGQAVVETTAAIDSSYSGFSPHSLRALCSAAFKDYPQPLTNAQFDVPVGD